MLLNKENFPYQIKKEYLSKAKIFKVITLIYICAYLGALISFVVLSYPMDEHTRGFLFWMACFGLPPIFILRNVCKEKLVERVPLSLGEEHKWACGPDCNEILQSESNEKKNFFQKLLRDNPSIKEKGPAFDFFDIFKKFNVFGKITEAIKEAYYLGTSFNRFFRLDYVILRNIFSLRKGGIYYLLSFKGFILRTTPIEQIKSTILIRPKSTFAKKIKNLQKVEINTQDLFEIYTDNPQTIQNDLPEKFISELIIYAKDIDKTITILITPEGILSAKPETEIKDFLSPVLFISLKNAFIKEWAKYENFINFLDVINSLELQK